jgi:hypothetical protein
MNQRFKHVVACSLRSGSFPHVSKSSLVAVRRHRRLTATTSFVREAAEGESSGIVCLKKFADDQTVPGGGVCSHGSKGHQQNTTNPTCTCHKTPLPNTRNGLAPYAVCQRPRKMRHESWKHATRSISVRCFRRSPFRPSCFTVMVTARCRPTRVEY